MEKVFWDKYHIKTDKGNKPCSDKIIGGSDEVVCSMDLNTQQIKGTKWCKVAFLFSFHSRFLKY